MLPHCYLTPFECYQILELVCNKIGQKPVKRIVFNSSDVHSCAGAHYNYRRKEIHCPRNFCTFITLIHEFTHHCGQMGHDDKFCEIEEFLFQLIYDEKILAQIFKKE